MPLSSHLYCDGQCEAAFKFYERCVGGKIEAMIPHEGSSAADHVPAERRSKILHARMVVGDWAARFGMLVDKFGTPWMANCEKASLRPVHKL